MKRTLRFLGILAFSFAWTCSPSMATGDFVDPLAEVDINGSALVGRRGSVDLLQFDPDPVIGSSGLLSISDNVSVGPIPFISSSFPGTAAVGTSTALSSIEYISPNEIAGGMVASVFLSSIEVDGGGNGSYATSASSQSSFDFQVDRSTDYMFEADALFSAADPSWQIRLLGSGGFLFNDLTNPGGGLLTFSGTFQPGVNYRFSAFTSVGLGGTLSPTVESGSIDFNLRAVSAVPEPSSTALIVFALCGMLLRRRQPVNDRQQVV